MAVKALLMLTWLLAAGSVFAKSLDLQFLDSKTRQELLQKFPQFGKGDFQRSDLEEAIKWLVETENFDSAQYRDSEQNGHYVIKTGKTQRVRNLVFSGEKVFSESQLQQILNIAPDTVFDKDALLEAAEHLRKSYKDLGYYNCVIDVQVQPTSTQDDDVTIKINENVLSRIQSLQIHSENPELQRKLQSRLANQLHQAFTPTVVQNITKDIRTYLLDNHYYKAEFSEPKINFSKDESAVGIEITITSAQMYLLQVPQLLGPISFADLREAINLDHYSTNTPNLSREIAAKIKAYYISQGFARVDANVTESEAVEPYHRNLNFTINEGPRVRINKIEFTGHFSKSEKYYVDNLLDLSSPILARKIFVKDDLDSALKNLVIDRQNNGYFKSKVISVRSAFNTDHDRVTISINFDEGPLTQIQNITFDGATQIPESELLNQLNLVPSSPLRLNQLEAGIANIKKYYHDHGFLEMTLLNEQNEKENLVTYNDDNTLAILHFKIFEGPKVMVASIAIEGNTITRDYVILKEIEFKVGDVLTPALIEESTARLQRLGIFTAIDIRTLEEKTMVSQRTVVIKVNDRDPGIYNFGAGVTNELGSAVRGFAGIAYRNISGKARLISLRGDFNAYTSSVQFVEGKISAGYVEPYLFDTRLKFRTNLTEAVYISDFNYLIATDVRQVVFSLEQEVTSHFLARWDLLNKANYLNYSIENNPNYATSNVIIGSTGPIFELDYRDNPFNPTRGSFSRFATEYGAPGILQSSTNVNYWRTLATTSYNWNFYKKFVWANLLRGGYLKNLQDPQIGGEVPWLQKGFLLGGQTTIRGFTSNEAFPNLNDLGPSYQLTTASTMYLVKSELRFPVHGNIGGEVFYDGGAVMINNFNYGFNYRHSAGFGARYITPVGALSVEIAWKLNEIASRGEGPYALDLSIGSF